MALAAKWLAARYNRPGFELFENRVYVLCSDGDLMEGISSEAASVAGHLKLNNLLWIYDDNTITIEGHTTLAFSEDVATRFEGYGWNALRVDDANDLGAIQRAIDSAKKVTDKPSIIVLKSIIGYGAPNKAKHTLRARRAARRRGDQAGQAVLRLARRRQVPRARRGSPAFFRGHWHARKGGSPTVGTKVRRV